MTPILEVMGRSTSINVRKVLWTCTELGLPISHQEWGAGELSLQSPEYLALNPNGLVPVIREDAFVMWESNAICRYLAARAGRDDLLPATALERARVEQWMDWQATDLNVAWRTAFLARVRHHTGFDEAQVQSSLRNWNRHMAILDQRLAETGAYAAGATFTLADIVLGLGVHRWQSTPMAAAERPELPAVAAYASLLAARDGWRLHAHAGVP